MKKTIISFFALLLVAQFTWAEVEPSTTLTTYYASIDGKATNANDDLRKTLCTVISTGYTSIGYSSLPEQMYAASSNPTDFVNGDNKTMEDIYSSKPYVSGDAKGSATTCGQGWNKEHTIPQSWFGGSSPMYSDAFHVYPTDIRMNSLRSSYPYGETDAAQGCAQYGYGRKGTSTFSGYDGEVFDPGEGGEHGSYKGDLARTYFYMMTRYRDKNFTSGLGSVCFVYSGGIANLTEYMKNLMLKWHREDPVSEKELLRNNAVYAHQHNRNPFIDYPELAEYIWGTKVGQTIVLANLVSAYDGETPPTPPTPVTKYGVTWSANGIETSVDSVAENSKIAALPETPISCSLESPIFMGWTTVPISSFTDEEPAELYTKPADFPAVTEDVTYYAVFAHAETVEYGPQLGDVAFTFEANKLSYEDDGVTIVFDKANGNNEPKFYDPAMRAYAKNTITVTADGITQVVFAFAANDGSNAITPNVGEFATNTWTGNADEVVFTIGGTSGHRKISSMTVTRNGTGGGEIYSRYITSCQDPTEVVEVLVRDASARKILIGGQIYILREGVVYSLTGSRIK